MVTPSSAATHRAGRKHLSFLRALGHLCQPLRRYVLACPSQPASYKPGTNQSSSRARTPFPPPSLTAPHAASHSKCTSLYAMYVAKWVLWRLQKATAMKPILARKINHMHICRTGSHTVLAVAKNERKFVKIQINISVHN